MASFSVSGSGTHTLSANTTALHVHVDTDSDVSSDGRANPTNRFHVGLLRAGDGTGWWRAWPIDANDAWFGLFQGVDRIGYALEGGAAITVTEVIGGSFPFQGPSGAAGAAGATGATGPTGAGFVVIDDTTLASATASWDKSSIPATYTHLLLDAYLRSDSSATNVHPLLRFNNDSGSNYEYQDWGRVNAANITANSTTGQTSIDLAQVVPTATDLISSDNFAAVRIWIPFYRASHRKVVTFDCVTPITTNQGVLRLSGSGVWHSTSVINRITLLGNLGNYVADSRFVLWGW